MQFSTGSYIRKFFPTIFILCITLEKVVIQKILDGSSGILDGSLGSWLHISPLSPSIEGCQELKFSRKV